MMYMMHHVKADARHGATQPGTVTDKVLDRCVEWAVTQMLDYFHPFKQLDALNLTRCHKLTDLSVVEIVRNMPYITDLTLVVRVLYLSV